MATNVNQKFYRSMLASMFSVSLVASSVCGFVESCSAQSVKKITPDPYYSTLRQSNAEAESNAKAQAMVPASLADSFYQPAWQPPKTPANITPARQAKLDKATSHAEVWDSVAPATTKPVTRIDFSRLDVKPAKKAADVALPNLANVTAQPLKPVGVAGAVAKAAKELKDQTLTPIKAINEKVTTAAAKAPQNAKNAIQTLKSKTAQTRSIIRQKDVNIFAAKTPALNVTPPSEARPLLPQKNSSDFNLPKIEKNAIAKTTEKVADASKEFVNKADRISAEAMNDSQVKLAAFEPQIGKNVKKLGSKIKSLAAGDHNPPAQQGTRVADASNNFYSPGQATYTPQGEVYSHPSQGTETYSEGFHQGESFENSRVLAIVGGHPIFVGDMMFEVNQILEKYMKGAPQEAKDAQKSKLMARLLPKYVESKTLYVSTVNQLPEGADINAILKQAEKTFNDKALPDLMKNSGVESAAKFDGILRSQGSSVRQMRRTWAKDQISKFFLQEKVKYNRQVTHLEMLDEYRSNFDEYAIKGKVRFEQIEIQPAKAGGRLAAKDKIEDIYNRLVHGGNFEAIAKKESHGFRAFKGGQYDWTNKGSLINKEIDEAIFSLPQGKLSGVIETKTGFHIIRVIERVEDHHTPFTEAQVEIKKSLLNDRREAAFRTYIDNLKEKIDVEYVNE